MEKLIGYCILCVWNMAIAANKVETDAMGRIIKHDNRKFQKVGKIIPPQF